MEQTRHQSTTINTVLLNSATKKKLKRRVKKYAELLEGTENFHSIFSTEFSTFSAMAFLHNCAVTDSLTSNRKAAIQNLNAAQLSILVDQPDITLDKLHKIKDQQQLLRKNRTKKKTCSPSADSEKSCASVS